MSMCVFLCVCETVRCMRVSLRVGHVRVCCVCTPRTHVRWGGGSQGEQTPCSLSPAVSCRLPGSGWQEGGRGLRAGGEGPAPSPEAFSGVRGQGCQRPSEALPPRLMLTWVHSSARGAASLPGALLPQPLLLLTVSPGPGRGKEGSGKPCQLRDFWSWQQPSLPAGAET